MKKAIVIGGGIGGLSIAARLLKDGFNVDLYEKNKSLGGKISQVKFADFKFDLTASLLMIILKFFLIVIKIIKIIFLLFLLTIFIKFFIMIIQIILFKQTYHLFVKL